MIKISSMFGDENHKMYKFFIKLDTMRKDNSKENRIEKHKKSHQPLSAFYTEEQRQQEQKEKHRKAVTDTEMEIFEHLKNHTKKILKKP
jgi:Mor family transcriptional regulator